MALESTQSFLCQFSLPPFSVFYLVDLVENKRQDVRSDGIRSGGLDGESCPHGRLSLEDRRNLTWQPVARPRIRLLQNRGVKGFATLIAEIGPMSLSSSVSGYCKTGGVKGFVTLVAEIGPISLSSSAYLNV